MKRISHSDSKRDAILAAAIRLFARQGVDGASIRDIGRAAGVTEAALYKHFASKEAVAKAIFIHYSDLYARLIDEFAARPGPLRLRWDALVAELVHQFEADRFGILIIMQRHHTFAELSPDHRRPLEALADMIRHGVEAGELPPQTPPLTAILVFGAISRLALVIDQGMIDIAVTQEVKIELQQRLRSLVGLP